jgi:hypothetical protein
MSIKYSGSRFSLLASVGVSSVGLWRVPKSEESSYIPTKLSLLPRFSTRDQHRWEGASCIAVKNGRFMSLSGKLRIVAPVFEMKVSQRPPLHIQLSTSRMQGETQRGRVGKCPRVWNRGATEVHTRRRGRNGGALSTTTNGWPLSAWPTKDLSPNATERKRSRFRCGNGRRAPRGTRRFRGPRRPRRWRCFRQKCFYAFSCPDAISMRVCNR